MVGRVCKVCTSHNSTRTAINTELLSDTSSLRSISAKYGISKSALHSHKARCMGVPPIPDIAERARKDKEKREKIAAISRVAYLESTLPSKEELGDVLGQCISRLDKIVARAEKNGADVVGISGIDAIRKQVGDLARLAGHVGGGSTQNINVGVSVSVSAKDIGASIASHLGALPTTDTANILELTANEP